MKICIFLTLLCLTGCMTHEPVSYLDYLCPSYEEFRNMQDTSNTSNCKRIVKDGKLINDRDITVNDPNPYRGGIFPVTIREHDGKVVEGFMIFPRVIFN